MILAYIDGLYWGDTPNRADPLLSWPVYGLVGGRHSFDPGSGGDIGTDPGPAMKRKREDEEIILILAAIIKEL